MDGSMAASRRKARSWRITAGVSVLGVATLAVPGALVAGAPLLVGAAGVFAVASGWVALRLAWNSIVDSRFEYAVDRTELARAYRALFAERSVEHQAFVADLSTRLAGRERTIHHLEGSLVGIRMRAVEAETAVSTFRRRLTDADRRIASMEELIGAELRDRTAPETEEPGPAAESRQPLLGRLRSASLRVDSVPEWADLDADPVAALVAWEEHAGRHTPDERSARQA